MYSRLKRLEGEEMKRKVAIVTDASAAVPPELIRSYDIGIVSLHVIVDGRDYLETEMNMDSLYERLRQKGEVPATSAPSVGEVLKAYERAASVAGAIVSIHLTSVFSATYNSAVEAAKQAVESHPGLSIRVIDSCTVEAGEGLLAIEAASLAASGADLDDVVKKVCDVRKRLCSLYAFETLFFRDRGGRIYKAKPWAIAEEHSGPGFKNLIQVDESTGGTVSRAGRATTKRKLLENAVEMAKARLAGDRLRGSIVHANAPADAAYLKVMVETELRCDALFVSEGLAASAVQNGEGFISFAFYPV